MMLPADFNWAVAVISAGEGLLLQDAVTVNTDQVVRDMLLKGEFGRSSGCHDVTLLGQDSRRSSHCRKKKHSALMAESPISKTANAPNRGFS